MLSLCVPVLALTAALSPSGEDAPATLFGRPLPPALPRDPAEIAARRAGFAQSLVDRGLVQRGDIVAPPAYFENVARPGVPAGAWELPPHRATIFLNFFGGVMTNGTNASLMESNCINGQVNYPAFASGEAFALSIIQIFQTKMEPYGVRIAYDAAPPPELPYQMVMMGGQPGDIGLPNGTLGVSCSSDCGDMWWRDTTFAFTEESGQATVLGTTALQEAAHAFGLAHIDGSSHIMYPYATSGDKVWATSCTTYNDATGGINCMPTHDIFCGGGSQNDDAELTAYFGTNSPDTVAPTVEILEPADGSEFPSGAAVPIRYEVTDDHEGAGWKVMVLSAAGDVLVEQPAFTFEKEWSLDFPDGEFLVRVQAVDHDRNVGSDEVRVFVGIDAPATSTDGSASSGGSSGDGSGTGTGTAGSEATPEKGCGCVAVPQAPRHVSATALLLLAAVRRRRRRG